MKSKNFVAAALLSSLTLGAAAAHATTITETFTGEFESGIDTYGWLTGVDGNYLAGTTFTETVSYVAPWTEGNLYGIYGVGATAQYATVTTQDGYTFSFDSGASKELVETDWTAGSTTELQFGAAGPIVTLYTNIDTAAPYVYGSLQTQAGTDTYVAGAVGFSLASQLFLSDLWGNNETLTFAVGSVGVPEPASITVLGAAIAGLGSMRRKRK